MTSGSAWTQPRSWPFSRPRASDVIVECNAVVKRFYRYEQRTRTMREFFIRTVLRRPIDVRRATFTLQRFDLPRERSGRVLVVGDQVFRERCFEHLHRFHANGGTLIVVSHDEAIVKELFTRAVWLDHGALRMTGRTAEVLDAYREAGAQPALPVAG
ncbi:MAG: hypothetical protein ACREMQ_01335 [Longimicrobiales bacterium]